MKRIVLVGLGIFLCATGLLAQVKQPYTAVAKPDGETYRFVVIGDLTGGELPGLFLYAVERVNELAPDFVMSVGDFIDGYTFNREVIREQWEQFHQVAGRLEAPFYYVPGNHDVGNAVLQEIWDNQYGPSYYTFMIRNDLFVVLNNFEAGKSGLSQTQTDRIMATVQSHPAGSRIFVFSHAPLWRGYDDFLASLAPYKAYYFCGHEHHYIHKTYKGQEHYMLAGLATGDEHNVSLGLYHNLLQVTVTPAKVYVANIELEGLLPPSVVDNHSEKQVNMFLANRWADIKPTVIQGDPGTVTSVLSVSNPGDYPLSVSVTSETIPGMKLHGVDDFSVPPGSSKNVPVKLDILTRTGIDSLPGMGFRLNGTIDESTSKTRFTPKSPKGDFRKALEDSSSPLGVRGDNRGKVISSELFAGWVVDYVRECNSNTNRYIRCMNPANVDESWDWTGIDDGSFEYNVYSDNRFIYIHVRTHDDVLIRSGSDSPVTDRVSVYFAPDTALKVKSQAVFDFAPGGKMTSGKENNLEIMGVEGKCEVEGNSIRASLKIPRKTVKGHGFRLNIAFTDADNPVNLDPAVIWWKPRWNSRKDYPGAGTFLMNNE